MTSTTFTSPTRRRSTRLPLWWLVYVPLIALFIFAVGPLLLAWFAAFKSGAQMLAEPFGPPIPPTLDNLRGPGTRGQFSIYSQNRVVLWGADVTGILLVSPLPGSSSPRLTFPGQKVLLYLLLIGLTI